MTALPNATSSPRETSCATAPSGRADPMGEPAAPTVDDLNASLDDRWPHGAITSAAAERIGSEHGFSGVVHRLLVETSTGRHRLLAKAEAAERLGRPVARLVERHRRAAGLRPGAADHRLGAGRGGAARAAGGPRGERAVAGPCEGLRESTRASTRPLLRGIVGMLGRQEDGAYPPRLRRLRDRAATDLSSILAWLDGE